MSNIADPIQDAIAAAIANFPPITGRTVLDTFGIVAGYEFDSTINPPSPSSNISPAVLGKTIYPLGAPALTGTAHLLGILGWLQNHQNTTSLTLGIGAEGKIDNYGTGTITTAVSVDCNLGSNAGTLNTWYGAYADLGGNTGTITTAVGYGLNVESNAGTITNYYGFLFPTLSTQNMTTTVIGFFFNNNPSITALKLAFYCADPTASITTLGPYSGAAITSSALTTTATFKLDTGTKTATAAAGAATLNKASGKITSEALTTAANTQYFLTLTNSQIAAADTVFASVANGTNSGGIPVVTSVVPGAGSVVIGVIAFGAAFNGTVVISFASMKA